MQTPDILAQAIAIAEAASALPMGHFRTPLPVEAKEDDSPVTIADRATEAFIRDRLRAAFPQDGIFGEEMGVENGEAEALWIIDPIDGTRSFITGNPLFGMLLGRVLAGVPQIGIVRMPALGETFAGRTGGGATLNGAAIRCRMTTRLDGALVYINEAEKIHAADPARFARLCGIGHTRRMAYDCYPHALVAAGQIDAVVDCGLQPYDYLPLIALVEAAGGVICDWQGQPLTLQSDGRVVTAATPALRDALLAVLAA
ncbi:myo-inositol-1(or 4)-monophosphatase [Gemmobacter aquatilis]|uniref:Myo-inositol-1(Or 4)-monophosphatase n=1 Tax=Gemmobacter aquatilis TaxID=933059 RepID=A0A1H8BN25_9RHOB|nr:inositol monophosphatase family protein [Gemmobacter aquatilis]SEM83448.1 myo-inositol-1(or 4)-monophosphatase [Gemmobacter aquatilis]